MWILMILAGLSAAAPEVQVTPLAGPPVTGTLVRLSTDGVTVSTPNGEQSFEAKDLLAVSRSAGVAETDSAAKCRIEFADGSLALVESFAATQGQASFNLMNAGSPTTGTRALMARTRDIKAVRFQPPSAGVNSQWEESVNSPRDGDQIVIRKMVRTAGDEKSEIVLDRLTGILQDITEETVKFQFEGDTIDVRREKLEGILYFQPAARELADPLCRVTDLSGGIWNVRSVQWTGEQFELETSAGVRLRLPALQVQKLDFSVANTQFLSDIEADSVEWTPYFESPSTASKLAKLFQPRRDTQLDGSRLMLRGISYEKGLAIHSRTTMVFRLPRNARAFLALAGIDDRVQDAGHVRLVISGDGKVLFDREISGKDDPIELNIDVAGVRRLTVLVDYGEGLDIGDHLVLCNARITK